MSNCLQPHGLQRSRLLCPLLSPRVCLHSCALSQWCHPTISPSVARFPCLPSFPASGSFPMRQLFTSGGQSIGASASIILFSYLLVIVTICVQVSVWMPIFSPLGWLSRNGSTGSYDPPTTYGPQFYDSLISHFLTLWWCRGDGVQ